MAFVVKWNTLPPPVSRMAKLKLMRYIWHHAVQFRGTSHKIFQAYTIRLTRDKIGVSLLQDLITLGVHYKPPTIVCVIRSPTMSPRVSLIPATYWHCVSWVLTYWRSWWNSTHGVQKGQHDSSTVRSRYNTVNWVCRPPVAYGGIRNPAGQFVKSLQLIFKIGHR